MICPSAEHDCAVFVFGNASVLIRGCAGRLVSDFQILVKRLKSLCAGGERLCMFVLIIETGICLGLGAAGSVGQLVPCMDFGTVQCGLAGFFQGWTVCSHRG